jgi:peptidoglycan/LPS O-acetylase OafA/YrhL
MSVAPRRWTVIASGLLVLALGLVVMFTTQGALLSPIALIVVAAIGLAALLFQVRFRQDLPNFRPPLALNVLGILCAGCALVADYLRMSHRTLELSAFATVACFGVSGLLILHALGRQRQPSP